MAKQDKSSTQHFGEGLIHLSKAFFALGFILLMLWIVFGNETITSIIPGIGSQKQDTNPEIQSSNSNVTGTTDFRPKISTNCERIRQLKCDLMNDEFIQKDTEALLGLEVCTMNFRMQNGWLNSCYNDVVELSGDVAYCGNVEPTSSLVSADNLKRGMKFSNKIEKDYCVAQALKDVDYCTTRDNSHGCLLSLALRHNDISVCNEINQDSSTAARCKRILSYDISTCENNVNGGSCFKEVAVQSLNISVCYQILDIDPEYSSTNYEQCVFEVAIGKREPSLCNELSKSFRTEKEIYDRNCRKILEAISLRDASKCLDFLKESETININDFSNTNRCLQELAKLTIK